MLTNISQILLLFAVLLVSGCGNAPTVEPPPVDTSVEALRSGLKSIAASGEGGSALEGVRMCVDDLQKIGHPRSKEIAELFLKVDNASDPDSRKVLAQEMIDKLD